MIPDIIHGHIEEIECEELVEIGKGYNDLTY